MAAAPYKPVSFTSESITQQKMQQMANNQQWLFEQAPKMRFSSSGIVRESGLRVLAGKVAFPAAAVNNFIYHVVYFGSFFSAGCYPVVTTGIESDGNGLLHRSDVVIQGLSGAGVDHTGFTAIIANENTAPQPKGWVHYMAIGY